MSNQVTVTSIPNCDICQAKRNPPTKAYADCYIPAYGTWSNVCKQHFAQYSCVLGTGYGQEYVLQDTSQPEQSQTERIKQNLKAAFDEAGEDGISFDTLEELFEDRDPMEFL